MSRIAPVTVIEFELLIEVARDFHEFHKEPIPELFPHKVPDLESSLNTPFQQFGGKYLYKGFIKKAAILFYLIVKNHPLGNGNKRMAILTLIWFCKKNNRSFAWTRQIMYDLPKRIASSLADDKDIEVRYIESTLKSIYQSK